MKNLPILTISLLAMLALGACKKEKPCKDPSNPKCENYDPCYGKKAPSADFIIGQSSPQSYFGMQSFEFISDDTMFAPFYRNIDFMAKEEGAEYEWKLGSETITARRFKRGFSNVGYGRYFATLTIRKEVDNTCFPDYIGTTTKTKYFEIRPLYEFPIMGVYRVLFDGETDSSTIEIRPWNIRRSSGFGSPWRIEDDMSENELTLIGFANGILPKADTIGQGYFNGELVSGNKIYTTCGHVCNSNIELKEGNKIFGEYRFKYYDPRISDTRYDQPMKFTGIKIQ
jgi:hypothetical protein